MNIKISLALLVFCMIINCDNSEDIFYSSNKKPILKFKKYGQAEIYQSAIYDSLKVINDSIYSFQYMLEDELSFKDFTIDYDFSLGGGEIEFISDSVINFIPENTGVNNFSITASDIYGEISSANASIFVFDNLPPVSVLNVIQQGSNYTFDCSSSYDNDANFGGTIVNYKLSISNITVINSSQPIIAYDGLYFENPFIVKLQVEDNNGGLSNEISQVLYPN